MGTTTDRRGVRSFWPDDTDTCFYVEGSLGLDVQDLQERIIEKWPRAKMAHVRIEADYVHIHNPSNKEYDPEEYKSFLVVRYTP